MSYYSKYVQSPAWVARREVYYQTHPKKCAHCGSFRGVQLHHVTYERLGRERDSDLVALCARCHQRTHAMQEITGPGNFGLQLATMSAEAEAKTEGSKAALKRRQKRLCIEPGLFETQKSSDTTLSEMLARPGVVSVSTRPRPRP